MIFKIIYIAVILAAIYLAIGFIAAFIKIRTTNRKHNAQKRDTARSKDEQVNPSVYDADYYLHGYSGDLKTYLSNLENLPIPLRRCFEYADLRQGEKVLDLGCGRGHLAYFCTLRGCYVTAVDYSKDAIELALKTKGALPPNVKGTMTVKHIDFKELDELEKYDIVFMADLLEHLYDWELKILFEKVRRMLKPVTGRLIIHTAPNKIWINFVFPLKRILDWPNTLRRGKDFYYTRDKYSYDTEMHINEQTLKGVRGVLKGFQSKVWCDDGSSNIISILTKRFAGADIWAIAKIDPV